MHARPAGSIMLQGPRIAVCGALTVGGRRAALRQSLLLAGGFGLALLLLLPWSGRLLSGGVLSRNSSRSSVTSRIRALGMKSNVGS